MKTRNLVVGMLCATVLAPILIFTSTFKDSYPSSSESGEFLEDLTAFTVGGDARHLNLLPQESSTTLSLKQPILVISDKIAQHSAHSQSQSQGSWEHKSARVLSATTNGLDQSKTDNPIRQVTDLTKTQINKHADQEQIKASDNHISAHHSQILDTKHQQESSLTYGVLEKKEPTKINNEKQTEQTTPPDFRVRQLKDQLIKAKVYLSLPAMRNNANFVRELRLRIKEVQRALGDATKDSDLPRIANDRLKAMEQSLAKGKQIQDDCAAVVKKLRAMLHSTEEQLRVHKKQTLFLTQLTAKTLPKGLHCLPLRLTTEYYTLNSSQRHFPNQEKLEDPRLFHYALFSDNVLAAAVVVNSTVTHAKVIYSSLKYALILPLVAKKIGENIRKLAISFLYSFVFLERWFRASINLLSFQRRPLLSVDMSNSPCCIEPLQHPSNHVFHIVTDRLNYAAMRMWFLANPPGRATVQVQNIEEFTWLNSSYSPVLKQLNSQSMIDYYFRAHRANSDSNLKFRNPKYLSILNHLRFYLPEVFPRLNKVLFLDDDVVVQKDLSGLWSIDLKGKVNGAVETCGETFHRFDRYLNFSNPLISKNFDPRACGWAYGMNIFDLDEWRRQNITDVYHTWQKMNHDRQLWKLGTLPPGLITFWKRTYPLDRFWHVLGLGYNPSVNQRDIERAAVIHYNGNMKPWLEINIPKYRNYWTKHVDYDQLYLRECNINP